MQMMDNTIMRLAIKSQMLKEKQIKVSCKAHTFNATHSETFRRVWEIFQVQIVETTT